MLDLLNCVPLCNPTNCNIKVHLLLLYQIGGIENVTLGDVEARARNCQKAILERKAPPTFDFLIEMRDRHYWLTHQVC